MLEGEHSAILSTFIKLPFVIKIFVLSIFEWPLKTGFTVLFSCCPSVCLSIPLSVHNISDFSICIGIHGLIFKIFHKHVHHNERTCKAIASNPASDTLKIIVGGQISHVQNLISYLYLLNSLSYYKIVHMHVQIMETICRAKVSDTLLHSHGHSKRSNVTCT